MKGVAKTNRTGNVRVLVAITDSRSSDLAIGIVVPLAVLRGGHILKDVRKDNQISSCRSS